MRFEVTESRVNNVFVICYLFCGSSCKPKARLFRMSPAKLVKHRGVTDILTAIKREERKLEKQFGKLNRQLNGVRAAAKALGHFAECETAGAKKRVLSPAGRSVIIKATQKRWAKVRKQAKKAAG